MWGSRFASFRRLLVWSCLSMFGDEVRYGFYVLCVRILLELTFRGQGHYGVLCQSVKIICILTIKARKSEAKLSIFLISSNVAEEVRKMLRQNSLKIQNKHVMLFKLNISRNFSLQTENKHDQYLSQTISTNLVLNKNNKTRCIK